MSDPFGLRSKDFKKSSPFVSSSRTMKDGVQDLINRKPNWQVYVRRLKYPSPDGYASETSSPYSDDQDTFGLGYQVQFEKHKVRRVFPVSSATSDLDEYGYLSKYRVVIYTPRYYYPQAKDLYLEVEWNVDIERIEDYGKPIHIINAYQVDDVVAYREHEVTYFGCGCNTYNFTLKDLDEWMKELGDVWVKPEII